MGLPYFLLSLVRRISQAAMIARMAIMRRNNPVGGEAGAGVTHVVITGVMTGPFSGAFITVIKANTDSPSGEKALKFNVFNRFLRRTQHNRIGFSLHLFLVTRERNDRHVQSSHLIHTLCPTYLR